MFWDGAGFHDWTSSFCQASLQRVASDYTVSWFCPSHRSEAPATAFAGALGEVMVGKRVLGERGVSRRRAPMPTSSSSPPCVRVHQIWGESMRSPAGLCVLLQGPHHLMIKAGTPCSSTIGLNLQPRVGQSMRQFMLQDRHRLALVAQSPVMAAYRRVRRQSKLQEKSRMASKNEKARRVANRMLESRPVTFK